ncbi:MAG TPA: archaeosortase/exosortase family protein [Chthoniobacterales bacterium]|nr:archaeosortase/exosortase family protein [Chthoniobacterales bacterium]
MALAVWPVWRWYVMRTVDGSDEPCGVIALATFLAIRLRERGSSSLRERDFMAPAVLIGLYVATFHYLSPLPRAIIAASAFASLLRGRTVIAESGLIALSLPVIATLQFYAGYPLRLIAAEGSALVLRALDLSVTREGSSLHWRGETIMVDGPCSGVRMLWVGLYLAAALASWTRLDNRRSTLLFAVAFVVVVFANVLRAALLFFKETCVVILPEWTHSGVGVLVFAGAALLILRMASRPEPQPSCA